MKRQQWLLLISGALLAAACLGAGWFLVTAMLEKNRAAEERNTAYASVRRIYSGSVFPDDETIARVKADEQALAEWMQGASNLVHKGDLVIEPKSPTGFKQSLQDTVRRLSALSGAVSGRIVPSGFHFGFDKYLGESDSLPVPEHVERLDRQLVIIERLCRELHAAKVLEIKAVSRDAFDEIQQDAAAPRREATTSRRRRSVQSREAAPTPTAAADSGSDYFSRQRFTLTFTARPAAFIQALNRLAAMDLFVVVAEAAFTKSGDPLAALENRKRDASTGDEDPLKAVDPAKVPHAERIVTDPDLDPPVSVKLTIDVYSFEGV